MMSLWAASLLAGAMGGVEPALEEPMIERDEVMLAWQPDGPPGPPPDGPPPPGRRDRDRRFEGGRRPPGRPGGPGVDVDVDVEVHGPPPMRPEDRLFRDGEFWVLEGSAIRIKANGEEKPFDPSGPITLKLADGREIEILPSRMPGPPPGGPGMGHPPGGQGSRRGGPAMGPPRGGREFGPPSREEEEFGPPRGEGEPPRPPHGPPPGLGRMLHDELRPSPLGKEAEELASKEVEIDREIHRLKRDWSQASSEQKEPIKNQIAERVNAQFQARQDLRRFVLDRIRQDVDRLDTSIKKREEARDSLIKRRIGEILGDGSAEF